MINTILITRWNIINLLHLNNNQNKNKLNWLKKPFNIVFLNSNNILYHNYQDEATLNSQQTQTT